MRIKKALLVRWTIFIPLLAFLPFPSPARGEEPVELKEILVTGEAPADLLTERRNDPVGKVIIGRKEIEAFGDQRAGDVLKRLPGLFMGGPPGENKDVRLRGLDKEYTQILIDGERVSGEGEKREFQVDQIPVDMIERIEIIRNPTAEHDQDAVGGIVNIILRKAPKKFTVSTRLGSGGQEGEGIFDTRDFSLNIGNGTERFRYQIGGSFLENVFQKRKTKDKTTPAGSEREVEDEEKTKRSTEIHLGLTTALTPRDDLTIRPFFLKADEEKEKEKLKKDGKEQEIEEEEKNKETSRISLKWKHRFLSSATLELGGAFNRQESDKDKVKNKSNLVGAGFVLDKTEKEDEKKEDEEWSLKGKFAFPLSLFDQDHFMTVGGKFREKDRIKRKKKIERSVATGIETDITQPRDNYDLNEEIGALFIQDEIEVSDRLLLTPGFRTEWTEGKFLDLKTKRRGSRNFTTYHPSVHLLYKIQPKTNIRASFARTIRRPKFDDLIPATEEKNDHVKIGNPFLEPETSLNYEAAIEWFWKKGFASIGSFYRDVDNKISEIKIGTDSNTGKDLIEPVNIGDGKILGAEVELKTSLEGIPLPPFKDMSFRGNFSWFDSEVKNQITGKTEAFKNQPDFIFNLILAYDYRPWGLGADIAWNYVDEKRDDTKLGESKREKALSTVDFSIRKRLGKHFALFLGAQNLFDEEKVKVKEKSGETEREVESVGRIYLFGLRGNW